MKFSSPWLLLLLILPLGWWAWRLFDLLRARKNNHAIARTESAVLFSSLELVKQKSRDLWRYFPLAREIVLSLALIFLIIALARPLGGASIQNNRFFGVDIVLALDVSGTMLFVDRVPANMPYREQFGQRFYLDPQRELEKVNRLNSARQVILDYVDKQPFNRIGVVIFAGYSYTKCPLTLDKAMVKQIISKVQYSPENDGTAIGMGIATAVNRLKKSTAKSRVIILLTDGNNNTGLVDPLSAAKIAAEYGIRIYTIGLGNPEGYLELNSARMDSYVFRMGAGIDEAALQQIADTTGGRFFRAYDADSLKKIYDAIDQLEKSRFDLKRRVLYRENFMPFLVIGALLLLVYTISGAVVVKFP